MLRVARRYRFSASHRLHSPFMSDEENTRIYGKCNNPYGHGHDYVLEVVLRGDADPETGLLTPLHRLDDYVHQTVLKDFDLKYMNEQIPVFRDVPPTTEFVAVEIERRLSEGWQAVFAGAPQLDAVRIYETRRNSVELKHE